MTSSGDEGRPTAETYVVLLRSVNLGAVNRVAMADLRALLGELGFEDPRTLLNSGNAVVTAPGATTAADVAARVGAGLSTRIGISTDVVALSASELASIAVENPLADVATNPSRLVVVFVADAGTLADAAPLARRDWGEEALAVGVHAAYVYSPAGVSASQALVALGRALAGTAFTTRNWATVLKLAALAGVDV